jgi:hypothetical protein
MSPKIGISTIAFSKDGLVATRNEAMPTTVWVWSIKLAGAFAVLAQHSVVKSVAWHPTIVDLLLIQCANNDAVYVWRSSWKEPRVVAMPFETISDKKRYEVRWIRTCENAKPIIMFNDGTQFYLGAVEGSSLSQQQTSHQLIAAPMAENLSSLEEQSGSYFNDVPTTSTDFIGTPDSSDGKLFSI